MGKPREILEQEKDGIKIVLEQIRLIRQQRSGEGVGEAQIISTRVMTVAAIGTEQQRWHVLKLKIN